MDLSCVKIWIFFISCNWTNNYPSYCVMICTLEFMSHLEHWNISFCPSILVNLSTWCCGCFSTSTRQLTHYLRSDLEVFQLSHVYWSTSCCLQVTRVRCTTRTLALWWPWWWGPRNTVLAPPCWQLFPASRCPCSRSSGPLLPRAPGATLTTARSVTLLTPRSDFTSLFTLSFNNFLSDLI